MCESIKETECCYRVDLRELGEAEEEEGFNSDSSDY